MTVRLRKIQGPFKIEATGTSITCFCLACGDVKSYIAFDGVNNEMIDLRLDAYRASHTPDCSKIKK